MDHASTLLLNESVPTTPQWVSHPRVSHERGRRFLPMHTYSSVSFHHPQWIQHQDYSCIYPLGIEHASTVEKGRDRDRERDQGKSLTRKVEKEMKKMRGTSHPKKFEARASDGHHRDYILLLFVGLARRALLFVFLFSFLSDSRIVSHLPFACKWQNMASSKTCFGIVNLLLLISRVTKVRLWTYESHAALRS